VSSSDSCTIRPYSRSMSENVGQRIAAERKIAGLSQQTLATRSAYSLSMIKAVEQGREPASAGFISAIARALRVTPEHLTGAPYDDGKPLSDAVNELSVLLAEGRYARCRSRPGRATRSGSHCGSATLSKRPNPSSDRSTTRDHPPGARSGQRSHR
jgi:transcriptional regulator with XRE-family HTH domain